MFVNNIIEVFLFVNPLGPNCFETEKLIETFSTERNEKIKLRFVPLLNFKSIGDMMKERNISSLTNRNKLYTDSYHASLAFQAASMQGKKKGRNFLMTLQHLVIEEGKEVTKELLVHIASLVKLDLDMFEEDLESDLSKKAFNKDQTLAMEMDVTNAPSCVVYSNNDLRQGYRIDQSITKQILHGLCNDQVSSSTHSHLTPISSIQTV
ncbi:hypothetical protein GCM10008929_01140 [Alkalibacterium psychrotolerans]